MKSIFAFIFLVFLTVNIHSQSKKTIIYVDEKNNETTFLNFSKKLESSLFTQSLTINDTVVFKRLNFKEFFGRLDSIKKSQLNKFFYNRNKIDTTKIWYIHFEGAFNPKKKPREKLDTLFLRKIKNSNQKGEKYYKVKTEKGILTNDPSMFKKIENFELSQIGDPKNVILLHFLKENGSVDKELKSSLHVDQNNLLKTLFNDGVQDYSLIIVHPNGDFYLTHNDYKFDRKELFKLKSFKREEKKWRRKYEKVN